MKPSETDTPLHRYILETASPDEDPRVQDSHLYTLFCEDAGLDPKTRQLPPRNRVLSKLEGLIQYAAKACLQESLAQKTALKDQLNTALKAAQAALAAFQPKSPETLQPCIDTGITLESVVADIRGRMKPKFSLKKL